MLDEVPDAATTATDDVHRFGSIGVERVLEGEADFGSVILARLASNGKGEVRSGQGLEVSRGGQATANGEARFLKRAERTCR